MWCDWHRKSLKPKEASGTCGRDLKRCLRGDTSETCGRDLPEAVDTSETCRRDLQRCFQPEQVRPLSEVVDIDSDSEATNFDVPIEDSPASTIVACGPPLIAKEAPVTSSSRSKVVIEVCCGSAKLTCELIAVGFDGIGIDYSGNKDKPRVKVLTIDLTTSWGRRELRRLIYETQPVFVWFAPPCGSASRAREIRRKVGFDPKPLRSDAFPDGVPGLCGTDKVRVEKANLIYKFTAEMATTLSQSKISWAIENPANSLMWATSWMKELLNDGEVGTKVATMQMCMHGGKRDKKTSLAYSGVVKLSSHALLCVSKHTPMHLGAQSKMIPEHSPLLPSGVTQPISVRRSLP